MENNRLVKLALAVAFLGLSAALPVAGANAADPGALRERIQDETEISREDIQAIEPELQEFSRHEGDPGQAAELVRNSLQNNCAGPCLREVMRSMNEAMAQGLNDTDAQALVSNTLREQVSRRAGEGEELGRSVRARVEQELRARTPGAEQPGMSPRVPGGMEAPGGGGMGGGGYRR
ncbi:MAG: hypothetical protein Q8P48_04930 [Deltaproteobacteria bacterium]|nr:hypothetical protein [Deltaproteobacteria bacterium]